MSDIKCQKVSHGSSEVVIMEWTIQSIYKFIMDNSECTIDSFRNIEMMRFKYSVVTNYLKLLDECGLINRVPYTKEHRSRNLVGKNGCLVSTVAAGAPETVSEGFKSSLSNPLKSNNLLHILNHVSEHACSSKIDGVFLKKHYYIYRALREIGWIKGKQMEPSLTKLGLEILEEYR